MHIPDLGHEHRRQHRANPGNGLDGQVADVAGQPSGDLPPQHGDLLS
jgi:hypothetical protein